MGDWIVTSSDSEQILTDVLLKTGALLLRSLFVDQLKEVGTLHRVRLRIQSPQGINKLPESFVLVQIEQTGDPPKLVSGLFEYAYGALRLVAVDDEVLANKNGNDIIAFFESPVQGEDKDLKVRIIEPMPSSK